MASVVYRKFVKNLGGYEEQDWKKTKKTFRTDSTKIMEIAEILQSPTFCDGSVYNKKLPTDLSSVFRSSNVEFLNLSG